MPNPNQIATKLQEHTHYLFLHGQLYVYQGGYYTPIDEIAVKSAIKKLLGDDSRRNYIHEVLEALELDVQMDDGQVDAGYLNVLNGMLDMQSFQLLPHDTKYRSTSQLAVPYNPKAACPRFQQVVQEWLGSNDKSQLLQEFGGYCLTLDTSQEKMLFLTGTGANGKSTFLNILCEILGPNNYSVIPLHEFSQRFWLYQLADKLVNVTHEEPSTFVLGSDIIKKVVSGERLQVDRKFHEPFMLKPHAKLIIASNGMPRINDKSEGLLRRILILCFNRKFTEKEQDRQLVSKLLVEKEGIFRWFLEGLKRLRQRGYFIEPSESIAAKHNFQEENDNVLAFINEACEVETESIISKDELYDQYQQWCKRSGYEAVGKVTFGKRLTELVQVGQDTQGPATKRERTWTGITLK